MEKHITLVLGAGASLQFGFPLGRGHIFQMWQDLRSSGPIQDVLRKLGNDQDLLNDFSTALKSSSQPSIDSFLESRPSFQNLGKQVIAATLIPLENPLELVRNPTQSWYEFIFGKLFTKDVKEFPKKPISVVTFNYDRSFEASLQLSLQHAYGLNPESAIEVAKRVEVVHMYGQLGNLWKSDGSYTRPYSPEMNEYVVQEAAKGIRIISEGRSDHAEISRAQAILDNSSDISFLGFGFHPDNVTRLGFPRPDQNVRVSSTCMGMTEAEISDASTFFPNRHHRIQFHSSSYDCLMGLRQLSWL